MKLARVILLGLICPMLCGQASQPAEPATAPAADDSTALRAKIVRLEQEMATLRAAAPASQPAKAKMARTFDQQPPRNGKEAKAMVGDRISGKVVVESVVVIPTSPGEQQVTARFWKNPVVTGTSRCQVMCRFTLNERSAIAIKESEILNLAGDIDLVDSPFPPTGQPNDQIVTYYLSAIQAQKAGRWEVRTRSLQ
jgi:hypothetical protein